ncbi:putative G-protein coupled receptor Mth-like 10 isoform X3 [Lycorma delicatula]|uniref:putative G-protein coupled receptor Mth-like 10 isoform X3 n=1 Tax=Lycorma delicatula TaxID=130591 RepID=UPI003F515609
MQKIGDDIKNQTVGESRSKNLHHDAHKRVREKGISQSEKRNSQREKREEEISQRKKEIPRWRKDDNFYTLTKYPFCKYDKRIHAAEVGNNSISTDFLILNDGGLKLNNTYYPAHSFCAEVAVHNPEKEVPTIFVCSDIGNPLTLKYIIYGIIYIIGAIFLFFTMFVYGFFPDLRKNVNDYNLIAHVSCLFLAYIGHIIIIFAIQLIKYNIVCKIMGFVLQFSLFASFLWLNIICVNISLAFSQLKPLTNTIQGQSEKNKFLYYSFYVWIITSLLTVITIVAEYSSILPEEFRPGFGENRCWFKGLKPSLLFFHGPMTATLLGNVALFLNTSFHIYMTQRDVAGVTKNVIHVHKGKRNPKNRYRFTIYMKLCFLMGITWIFEVLSVLYYDSLIILWNITDILNLLRALFIFALFCCKDKVIRIIKARIFKSKNDRHNSSQRSVGNFSKKASLSSIRTSSFQLSRLSISQVVDKNCVY